MMQGRSDYRDRLCDGSYLHPTVVANGSQSTLAPVSSGPAMTLAQLLMQ